MEKPSYLKLLKSGSLAEIKNFLLQKLQKCDICPHNCLVDRTSGEKGKCNGGSLPKISSAFPHFGEEPPITGKNGSGTIFFTGCNLRCVFCQNYDISHLEAGFEISIAELADIMVKLQARGCHNINLVTPTHFLPQIVAAVEIAAEKGLHIPIVYNSSGYEKPETLKVVEGVIDIYMPDFKFFDSSLSERFTIAGNYPDFAKRAIQEMYRQVGPLKTDNHGIAYRGLLIRHLVMPGQVHDSRMIVKFLSETLPERTYLNIMCQYRPYYLAQKFPEINRSPDYRECLEVATFAKKLGFFSEDW